MSGNNVIVEKSKAFALRIIKLYKYLTEKYKISPIANQILKSGTSIGANVKEAIRGQSKADFSAKMCIALKEANESHYWIRLLYKTDFLTEQEFNSIENDIIVAVYSFINQYSLPSNDSSPVMGSTVLVSMFWVIGYHTFVLFSS